MFFILNHAYLHLRKKGRLYLLNINSPKTFNEKINWLKIHGYKKENHYKADKLKVREYIKDCIGENYLIPMLGVYDTADDINSECLPNKFVVKTNHGSGYNIICNNKNKFDFNLMKKKINSWMKQNYYYYGKEWQYFGINPKIMIEKHLIDKLGDELLDYKFFCFNGIVKYIQIDIGRFSNHKRLYFDRNWETQDFTILYPRSNQKISKPDNLEEMLSISEKLSKDMVFSRIDLYNINSKIYFGEITFHPEGGCGPFFPNKYDLELGNKLVLPN